MSYILMLIFTTSMTVQAVTNVEFNSVVACEAARGYLMESIVLPHDGVLLQGTCLAKGKK